MNFCSGNREQEFFHSLSVVSIGIRFSPFLGSLGGFARKCTSKAISSQFLQSEVYVKNGRLHRQDRGVDTDTLGYGCWQMIVTADSYRLE